ncbi:two-component regulator propeller domain-containing protein [Rubrivirga marina]|uniref:Two component regulator three Y domain-containing protein n=1 Tax=Rubrivirga marina TaxID=1196024 RepID=A0A271J2P9_9BACT|nr:two-component regulator propeller domain-containing protein [Rubrivirga marina]PAP77620.1 hypothetical protein BSZ37_14805 [Rubrivirga marina]
MPVRLVLLLAVLATGAARSQTTDPAPDVRFDRLGLDLPHPEVQALAQDADGLIWIGTRDGLLRYDGLGPTLLRRDVGDARSLPSNDVEALLVDGAGRLWVGTQRGVARLDPRTDRFTRVTPAEGTCGGAATWLAETGPGQILYGSRRAGLCRLDAASGERQRIRVPWGGADGRAWEVQTVASGAAWVLGPRPEDACRVDPGPDARCRSIDLSGFGPRVLGLDAEGRLLAYGRPLDGGPHELRRWSRGRFVPVVRDLPEVGWTESADLVVVGREAWLGTATDGLLAVGLETSDWRWLGPRPGDPTSLPAPRVRALLVDRQGGAWVGTSRGVAAWRAPAQPFRVYRRFTGEPGEISDDRVNGMTEARGGALWVATNDGLNRLDPETDRFETFRIPEVQGAGPPAWVPDRDDPFRDAWWQVFEGADGTLWVGGKRAGLFRLDRRTGRFRREAEASRALGLTEADGTTPRGFGVRHIYEDEAGRLWVGTTGEGLALRQADGRWVGVFPASGAGSLPHPNVNRVHEAEDGTLWVGTDAGLARVVDPGAGREMTFEPVDLGESAPVWAVAESPATPGKLWVGTVGNGLLAFDPESGRAVRVGGDEFPSDLVYGVLTDETGQVWASTNRGLARYDPTSDCLSVYDAGNGLRDDAFDLMAFDRSPTTGELWFGGPNGLVRVDPDGVGLATYHPPVAFTGVEVFDRRRAGRPLDGDTIRVAHDENFLTVQFAALDYTAPRQLRYLYRLLGVDADWRETTGERPLATYTALEPGTYTLLVLGSNADGVWNDEPARLTIVVEPAWWQGIPARAVALLLLAGLGLVGVLGVMHLAARDYRRRQQDVADDLHRGPVRGIGEIGRDLDGVETDGEVVRRVRRRVGEVEVGLHDALIRLRPAAAGTLGLTRALDATVRRARQQAPDVAIQTDWSAAPASLPDDLQHDFVSVLACLLDHALQTADPDELRVTVTVDDTGIGLRVVADRPVAVRAPGLRRRLPGTKNPLVQALRIVRQRGGALDVEPTEAGSVVSVRLGR